jgi:folate-binding protein YgfZ
LVNPNARILDVFNIFIDRGEWKLGLISLPGYADNTTRFLQSRILFMDNVTVTDTSRITGQIILAGNLAESILYSLGIDPVPELEKVVFGTIAYVPVRVLGERVLQKRGYRIVFPQESRHLIERKFLESGSAPLAIDSYHVLRIESGIPVAGAELVDAYTPLEAGLESAISSTKGCYTGQEVIARQLTYDKVTRHLVGLRLEDIVDPGGTVSADGKKAGTITSSAHSPRFGPIALAYIKRPYHKPGVNVKVNHDRAGGDIPAMVTTLPFA